MSITGLHVENVMVKTAKREIAVVTIDMMRGTVKPSGINLAGMLFFKYMPAQFTHYGVVLAAVKPFRIEVILIDARIILMCLVCAFKIAIVTYLPMHVIVVRDGSGSPVMCFYIHIAAS